MSIIICHKEAYQRYRQLLMMKQNQNVQERLHQAFESLMSKIKIEATDSNKEKFTSNLQAFALDVAKYCVRPDL